jgi:hypothetical protein
VNTLPLHLQGATAMPQPYPILFALLLPCCAAAQDCTPARYHRMMREADTAAQNGQYDLAINKLQSAKTCQPDSEAVVNLRVLEVFKEVNRQRELAIKNEREAKKQTKIAQTEREKAEANLAKANRLIHHLNFREEEAAWAYKDGKFAVINLNGDTLTDFVYTSPEPFRGGKSISQINNEYVFISKTGQEDSVRYDFLAKMPFGYFLTQGGDRFFLDAEGNLYTLGKSRDDGLTIIKQGEREGLMDSLGRIIVLPNSESVSDFSEGFYPVKYGEQWGFVGLDGQAVFSGRYEDVGSFSEGLAAAQQGGKWGFIDTLGQWKIMPLYDEVFSFAKNRATVKVGEKWGLIDPSGRTVIGFDYESIDYYGEGLIWVRQEGKWGIANHAGEIVTSPRYDKSGHPDGDHWVQVEEKWGFINKLGVETVAPLYDETGDFSEGMVSAMMDEKWGFVDTTGVVRTPLIYESVGDFHEGRAWVESAEKHGFVDAFGKLSIPAQYDNVLDFSEGLAGVKTGDEWGYVDTTGTIRIPAQYESVDHFLGGFARAQKEGKWGFINRKGAIFVDFKYDDADGFGGEFAHVKQGETWLRLNKKGEILPDIDYKIAQEGFSEGFARVNEDGSRDRRGNINGGRWGYIDSAQRLIVPCKYEDAEPFSEGRAAVKRNGLWTFINQKGYEILEPRFQAVGNYANGFARAKKDGKWEMIDLSGLAPSFVSYKYPFGYSSFSGEGLFEVVENNRYGLVDHMGKTVLAPQYEQIRSFQEGLALARTNDKWGYIDSLGDWAISPKYEAAEVFNGGYAKVRLNEKWGLIDKSGVEVVPLQYETPENLYKIFGINNEEGIEGTSSIEQSKVPVWIKKGERWHWIDSTGRSILSVEFDEVRYFSPTLFQVRQGEKWGLIEHSGKVVLPPTYHSIENIGAGFYWIISPDSTRFGVGLLNESGRV